MEPFWPDIIHPLLRCATPGTILEIGAEAGRTTRHLLAYCRAEGAVLHSIDPAPRFPADDWVERFDPHFRFHRGRSLDVLPSLPPFDAALIDGDHNWYSVLNELRLLDRPGRNYPLVFLHDMEWPYARRDLYYDPSTIPDNARLPHARKGIVPGQSELSETSGVNAALANATVEGGPRNGVRTAVEDYIAESARHMKLVIVPGFHGLGILYETRMVGTRGAFGEAIEAVRPGSVLVQYLRRLEAARLGFRPKPG